MDERLLRELTPAVIGILVRRGADFATAEDAVQEALVEAVRTWADDPPRDPKGWLVTVAWRRFLDLTRSETVAGPAGARRRRRARAGPGPRARRHPPALLPLRPPLPDPRLRRRADPPRGRRPHHPADRRGLPRPRGDHGAADQPGEAHRLRGAARPARRPRHRAPGALPRLQRGLLRRRRPRRRGDPARPPARGDDRRARGAPASSRSCCSTTPAAPPAPVPTAASSRWPSRTASRWDTDAHRRGCRDPPDRARPRPARRLPGPGRDRRPARRRAVGPRRPTGCRSSAGTTSCSRLHDSPVVRLNRAVAVAEADGAAGRVRRPGRPGPVACRGSARSRRTSTRRRATSPRRPPATPRRRGPPRTRPSATTSPARPPGSTPRSGVERVADAAVRRTARCPRAARTT